MSLPAAVLRKMMEKGLSLADAVEIAELWEEGSSQPVPQLSKAALRTRKWRERLESTGLSAEEWRTLSAKVIARDKGTCRYCGTTKGRMACDHVTPLIQGGDNSGSNLVCACQACNGGKSGQTLEQWRGEAWAAEWRQRGVTSRDVTGDVSHVGERVVLASLPSLRSEELKPPVSPNGLTAPKGQTTARGSRIPDNWSPVPDYEPEAFGLGRDQHDAELAKFLDYWRSVPGAKGRKTDWPATWRNWMRRASETSARKAPHERPHTDPKFDARQANLARAFAGSESAFGRTGKP